MDNSSKDRLLALEYQLWLKEHLICLLDPITWFDWYNSYKYKLVGDKIGIGDVGKGLGRIESEIIKIDGSLLTFNIELFNKTKDFHFMFTVEKMKGRLYSFKGRIIKNKYGIAGSEFEFVKHSGYRFIGEKVFCSYIEKQMKAWFPYTYN